MRTQAKKKKERKEKMKKNFQHLRKKNESNMRQKYTSEQTRQGSKLNRRKCTETEGENKMSREEERD